MRQSLCCSPWTDLRGVLLSGLQVSKNAKQDLKDGLVLYNSENNIGLRNAWNIIQAEVRTR